jgi:hypothetical protein
MIGPGYGYQWRHFGASYDCLTGKPHLNNLGLFNAVQLQLKTLNKILTIIK